MLGAIASMVLFFAMGYFYGSSTLYILSLISGFIGVLIDLPYETHLYEKSKSDKHSTLEFIVFKEFSIFFGRLFFFGTLVIFFSQVDIAFYLGSMSSILFLFF